MANVISLERPPSKYMKRFARCGRRVIWALDPEGFYEDPGFEGAEFKDEQAVLSLPTSRGSNYCQEGDRPRALPMPAPNWNDLVLGGSVFTEFKCGGFPSWEAAEEWMMPDGPR